MKKHVKVYLTENGYAICDAETIMCEYCREQLANAIHHIMYKSQGGKDENSNLIALCQGCHNLAHDGKITKTILFEIAEMRITA